MITPSIARVRRVESHRTAAVEVVRVEDPAARSRLIDVLLAVLAAARGGR
jgi:hypothetical protein